jgi:LPS export ABC transporter permease LptF/LPS export ABC transporter permease LptG
MKPRPGQDVATRGGIAILRLVHVPKHHDMDSRHARAPANVRDVDMLEWRSSAMRIIDRYIFREVLSHALLGLGVFTFVIFVPQLVQIMNVVARHSGDSRQIMLLFLSAFPRVLTFSVPIGVLVGVLIGLGRMSADSELIAMNAAGMGLKRILVPVGILAALATGVTLSMTLWLGPMSIRTLRSLEERLRSTQASFEVQPRIFNEQFPHLVLYVQDISAAAMNWHGVFLAESDVSDVSRLTLAEDAIVVADREQGKLQLYLRNGTLHELQGPEHYGLSAFGERDFAVAVSANNGTQAPETINSERPLRQLLSDQGPRATESRVEFHRRFAFPAACLVFALVALPVGSRPRRGGRSAGFVLAVALVCAYYIVFVFCAELARNGSLPIWLGIWTANILMAIAGFALLPSVERLSGESRVAGAIARLSRLWQKPKQTHEPYLKGEPDFGAAKEAQPRSRFVGRFPQVIDYYLLRNFIFYFALLLVGFILLFEIVTFFDLLDDIARHRALFVDVANYFRYLSYYLIYQLTPLACLVSILITLGIMTKNNELVAFKAAGISLYRVALPLLLAGGVVTIGLVAFDQTYLPYANQRAEELRNIIKGSPPQTYYQPQRQWIFGNNSKIYNYQLFDPDHFLFGGLSVFELDPQTFALRRRVYAERASWEPRQGAWILQSGWIRDFKDGSITRYAEFPVMELPELDEAPAYFTREIRQSSQMDWWELRNYIAKMRRSGFDVARFAVQLHKKLAFPLIAPIVILLAIPFSILVGSRGAVGGLALGVGLAVVYWATAALFEAMGAVGQLPALLSAWSPDFMFFFFGLYFFLKMPT